MVHINWKKKGLFSPTALITLTNMTNVGWKFAYSYAFSSAHFKNHYKKFSFSFSDILYSLYSINLVYRKFKFWCWLLTVKISVNLQKRRCGWRKFNIKVDQLHQLVKLEWSDLIRGLYVSQEKAELLGASLHVEEVFLPSLHIKSGLMKNFVKAMNREGKAFFGR